MKLTEHALTINAIKHAFREKKKEIEADERFSSEYKITLINAERANLIDRIESQAAAMTADLKALIDAAQKADNDNAVFNLSDPAFINALNILNTMQKNTPEAITKQIINAFKDNRAALTMMYPLFDEYGLVNAAIDAKAILSKPTQYQRLIGIDDLMYYSARKEDEYFTPEDFKQIEAAETPDPVSVNQ